MIFDAHRRTPEIGIWLLAAGTSLSLVAWASAQAAPEEPVPSAAPGYANDRSCAICHPEIYDAYREVGMARSFFRPSSARIIEDFDDNHYFHERGGCHYEMSHRDGRFFFRRYQIAPDGEPIHVFEREIHWVLGSGNHSRTYLFQTGSGELFQLPIAWYTQSSSWGMAPGFDKPGFVGIARQVRRECMFCHNAYPDVPAGSDVHYARPVYPADLPEGTGCQRCHGPAKEHVRAAEELEDKDRVRSLITNPGRLPDRLRDDVCDQCHLQPSVTLPGIRRFGRPDYSYRPGESLAEYLAYVDVDTEGEERSERFEINHHPYRLRQSRCWKESGRELSCLTCHDPHRKVPAEERAAHYRRACLTCHQVDSCRLEAMASGESSAGVVHPEDCAACHMPKRRTQDVVHVVMTDHLIRRRPGGPELLAPLEESVPVLVDVELLDKDRAPSGPLGEMYRAAAVLRAGETSAVDYLQKMLAAARPAEIEPHLDLAKALIQLKRYEEAEPVLTGILGRNETVPYQDVLHEDVPRAREWLAIARSRLGRIDEAAAMLRQVVDEDPIRAVDAGFNLGLILNATGDFEEAVQVLGRAVEARPVLAPAWYQLGKAQASLARPDEAIESFRKALAIDPAYDRCYLALGEALIGQGRRAEALRYWRHGVKLALNPALISEALKAAEAIPGAR